MSRQPPTLKGLISSVGDQMLGAACWFAVPLVLLFARVPIPYVVLGAFAQIAAVVALSSFFQRRRATSRSHLSFQSIEAEFSDSGWERDAIEAAYLDISRDRGHPVQRYDLIQKTLGFLPEDFASLARSRLSELGVPDLDTSAYAKASNDVRTVDDYVGFLSHVIRLEREKKGAPE
ncbi:MAG: hypothetical protein WDM94_12560 [Bauldia sp.]